MQIADEETELAIRQAALIQLKNTVKNLWKKGGIGE